MKTNKNPVMALSLAGLVGVCVAVSGCDQDEQTSAGITPAQQAAAEKAAVDRALAEDEAADKAAADKAAADKAAADQLAAQRASAAKAAADKAAADEKAAADAKAAAERTAAMEEAHAASLPADLVVMKSEISQALSQIDMSIAKLEVLAVTTDNLKQASKDAVTAIDALEKSTQSIQKRADDMRERGAAYFETWEKQLAAMSTPEVAEIAARRKDELSAKYAQVLTSMQESRAAFDPFWAEMETIRKAISDDMNAQKQQALGAQVKSVKEKAATLKSRVEDTLAQLNQVSGIYTNK